MSGKIRFGFCVATASIVLFLAGCVGQYTIFAPTDKESHFKPGSLAVVSGFGDELSVALAQQVTQDLQARSQFKVMPQAGITEKFKSYPANILDDPKSVTEADRGKIDKIQKGLGVDYVFVLWTYDSQTRSGSAVLGENLRFSVGGKLLAYPGSRDAGMSDFAYEMGRLFKSEKETIQQMVKNASEELVTTFLEKTGAGKTD